MSLLCQLCRLHQQAGIFTKYSCRVTESFLQCSGAVAVMQAKWNSNRASLAKTNRKTYTRLYKTLMVNPDGSSYYVKFSEPRKILRIPFDISKLSQEERKIRLSKYTARKNLNIEDKLQDSFDARKYKQFWKIRR